MLNNVYKLIIFLLINSSILDADIAVNFHILDKEQELLIESLEEETDFEVLEVYEDVNTIYKDKYGNPKSQDYDKDWSDSLDKLTFISLSNYRALYDILISSPDIAIFAPFSLLYYKLIEGKQSYLGYLNPNLMLDIAGIDDNKTRKRFSAMYKSLNSYLNNSYGEKVKSVQYHSLALNSIIKFEIDFEGKATSSDYIEIFQEKFEMLFEDQGYVFAGYKDYIDIYEDLEMPFEEYDQFFVYSLCDFTFSYNIFNKGRPDIGVFAPCSMYFYMKKDSATMVVGVQNLATWSRVMNIKDPAKLKWIEKADIKIRDIMKSLGAKEL